MIMVMVILVLLVLGLVLGSFVNALVWRLHENKDWLKGRSECPNCHHQLSAKDLIPLVSWFALKGKCRYCKKPISVQYPLVEALTTALFILSYAYWPSPLRGIEIAIFCIWLVIVVVLLGLAVYDVRWRLLPNYLVATLGGLIVVSLILESIKSNGNILLGALWGLFIIGGLFYVLYQVSGGKWIGGGDVKLGAALGLLVGGPLTSVLLLLMASTSGTLYSLPFVATGKAKRNTQVPFGPFLIVAAVLTRLFGQAIISWYKKLY